VPVGSGKEDLVAHIYTILLGLSRAGEKNHQMKIRIISDVQRACVCECLGLFIMPGEKNGFKVYNERTIKLPVTLEPVGVKDSVIIE